MSLRQPLLDGLRQLGIEADAGQTDRLLAYLGLLERWNRVFNLTSIREPVQMLRQHLLDSAAIVPPLRAWLVSWRLAGRPGQRPRLLDVGSGGGLPGVVVAILMPEADVVCLDAVAKKASFVRQVAGELSLPNLQAGHGRVETMAGQRFDVVASRAFASLADFIALTRERLAPGGVWLAMKGKRPDDELRALPDDIQVTAVQALEVPGVRAERCLVWMTPKT